MQKAKQRRILEQRLHLSTIRAIKLLSQTKVRLRTGPGPNQMGLPSGHILTSIDASLRRLELDYIDLYQIRGVDHETPIEATLLALNDIVRSGKVRYVGFSNFPAWLAIEAIGYSNAHNLSRFVSAQMYYLLTDGLISGKFDLDKSSPAVARRSTFDFPPVDRPCVTTVLKALRGVSEAMGISVVCVAVAWFLTHPFVTSVIIGAKTHEQLVDNLASSDVQLSPEQVAQLDVASAFPSEYPGCMVN